jgi:type IV secretion system protein VirD4
MRRQTNKFSVKMLILYLIGLVPVVWLSLRSAPFFIENGLVGVLENADSIFNDPFHITLVKGSLRVALIFCLIYVVGIGIYLSTERNYRRREEHGSAKWGEANAVNKKYKQQPFENNKLMTQNVRIGLNAKKHRRNLNTLVCGGSGAGKTRFYCKPNLMQANTSFVILDPKGEILRDTGYLLEKKG